MADNTQNVSYQRNTLLKPKGINHKFTPKQVKEYMLCRDDPIYFIRKYVKIVNVDKGLMFFDLHDYQEDMIRLFDANRFCITKCPRQVGKTSCSAAYLLWMAIFNSDKTIGIFANKADTAREILARVRLMFEYLPKWIQQGIITWNKGDIEFENRSQIIAFAVASSAARGYSFTNILLDEFAFVPRNIQQEFFTSVYPTISSGKSTKVIITSTPNGIGDWFYKLWMGAVEKTNDFMNFSIEWSDHPERDEVWKREQIRNTSPEQFSQEHECVTGDTIIRLKRPQIERIYEISIKKAYDEFMNNWKDGDSTIRPNKEDWLIESGTGIFRGFSGILRKKPEKELVQINTTGEQKLICSRSHQLYTPKNGWIWAKDILAGDWIYTYKNNTKDVEKVISVIPVAHTYDEWLYDPLDCESYISNGFVSHNCEFLGSANTLIRAKKIMTMAHRKPEYDSGDGLKLYSKPVPGRIYAMVCDVARGAGNDYSAFIIFDITEFPFRVVGTFRDNNTPPLLFPNIIYPVAKQYNECMCLIENKDAGGQVCDILSLDLGYEHVLSTQMRGRKGQILSNGVGQNNVYGVSTSKAVKALGCSNFKSLVEQDKLIIEDLDLIAEISTFIQNKKGSYSGDVGCNDDMVMCCVLFAWMIDQQYFKALQKEDFRRAIYKDRAKAIEDDIIPFGYRADDIFDSYRGVGKEKMNPNEQIVHTWENESIHKLW